MKTGFASGNGKPLQIGWKRRRIIFPHLYPNRWAFVNKIGDYTI
jgi:hypothetical protein